MFFYLFFLLAWFSALSGGEAMNLKLESSAFKEKGSIAKQYCCDWKDISPPMRWEGVPQGAKSLVLIVDDPDAPRKTWVHWVLYNIPPSTTDMKEGSVPKEALQGINDFQKEAYGGPCPPSGT